MIWLFVAVQTPLPVRVSNFPPQDITSYHWSIAAAIAAIAAAVVAVITLAAVIRQLRLANDALDLARNELAAVLEQGELMKRQDAVGLEQTRLMTEQTRLAAIQSDIVNSQILRRSKLSFAFDMENEPHQPATTRVGTSCGFQLTFLTHNTGDKPSRDFYATVLIPKELGQTTNQTYVGNIADQGLKDHEGRQYRVYQNKNDGPLYRNRWMTIGSWPMLAPPGEYVCLWHLSDEDGEYPGDSYGEARLLIRMPGE